MEVDCCLESVTGVSIGEKVLSNAGQSLSGNMSDNGNLSENMSEFVPNTEQVPVDAVSLSSPGDQNIDLQQCAKTKGTLRQQLKMKRQQLISSNAAAAESMSTESSDKKKTASPNRVTSQVHCCYIWAKKHLSASKISWVIGTKM